MNAKTFYIIYIYIYIPMIYDWFTADIPVIPTAVYNVDVFIYIYIIYKSYYMISAEPTDMKQRGRIGIFGNAFYRVD